MLLDTESEDDLSLGISSDPYINSGIKEFDIKSLVKPGFVGTTVADWERESKLNTLVSVVGVIKVTTA